MLSTPLMQRLHFNLQHKNESSLTIRLAIVHLGLADIGNENIMNTFLSTTSSSQCNFYKIKCFFKKKRSIFSGPYRETETGTIFFD